MHKQHVGSWQYVGISSFFLESWIFSLIGTSFQAEPLQQQTLHIPAGLILNKDFCLRL